MSGAVTDTGTLVVATGGTLTLNGTWTINGSMSVSGTVVNVGTRAGAGALTFNAGGTYVHAQNGGTIAAATWNVNSTASITGVTTTVPSGGFGQAFGNFTWNNGSQTAAISLAGALASSQGSSVAGTFSVASTGSGSFRLLNSGSVLDLSVGAFAQSGGTFYVLGTASSGTNGFTLNVAGNFSLSGGTLNVSGATGGTSNGAINIAGNFSQSGGTLTEAATVGTQTVTFNAAGTQTYSFTAGTVSQNVNFAVSSGATLETRDEPVGEWEPRHL